MRTAAVTESLASAATRSRLSISDLNRVHAGRGTPREIHALTQALIDARPTGPPWTAAGIRKLMFDHMIGLDGAGYAAQAYLAATARTAERVGFRPVLNENLGGLARRGFSRFEEVHLLRPGDLVVFRPQPWEHHDPGHRAIIYRQRIVSLRDMRALLSCAAGQAFARGGTVRVVEMDSSFASRGRFHLGGVERQAWLHSEGTGTWARMTSTSHAITLEKADTLYGQPLEGFYRWRGD